MPRDRPQLPFMWIPPLLGHALLRCLLPALLPNTQTSDRWALTANVNYTQTHFIHHQRLGIARSLAVAVMN